MIDGRLSEVRVWATPEVITAVQQHLFAETIFPKLPENLVFRDITQVESVPVGNNLQVAHRVLVSHPGQSRGYRLEYGGPRPQPLLAYVTDTTVDGTYDDFVDQVPCLIHECYFGAANAHWAHATGHSTSHMVGELGARCHAQRLILVHADPLETLPEQELLSECRSRYPTAELAWDGKVLCLNNLL
jgi:ribonuclease BN (tRNA processing enzyme)